MAQEGGEIQSNNVTPEKTQGITGTGVNALRLIAKRDGVDTQVSVPVPAIEPRKKSRSSWRSRLGAVAISMASMFNGGSQPGQHENQLSPSDPGIALTTEVSGKGQKIEEGHVSDMLGQITSYFKSEVTGDFSMKTLDRENNERLAKSLPVQISQTSEDSADGKIPAGSQIIEFTNLKGQMPKFKDIKGEMIYGPDGHLIKTVVKGHFEDKDVPASTGNDEEDKIILTEIIDKTFKTKALGMSTAQFSDVAITDDSINAGLDKNGFPLLPELHVFQSSAHSQADDLAKIAVNGNKGFALIITPPIEGTGDSPNAKG